MSAFLTIPWTEDDVYDCTGDEIPVEVRVSLEDGEVLIDHGETLLILPVQDFDTIAAFVLQQQLQTQEVEIELEQDDYDF